MKSKMYVFIVNLLAGNGLAKRNFAKIKTSHQYKKINSRYFLTQYKGHAEEIIRGLLKQRSFENVATIIVIGGDGTLHEVMNGLHDYNIPVAIIPSGSGNDFARACEIKGRKIHIFHRIIKKRGRFLYWLGEYKVKQSKKERFIINSIGFGFDAEIARIVNESFYKRIFNFFHISKVSYIIALIQVIIRFKPMNLILDYDGRRQKLRNCWMVSIGNHPFYAGGMKVFPKTEINPDVFSVLIIHSISRLKILLLFMTVFIGKHIKFKEIELLKAANIAVYAQKEIPFQVDGETSMCWQCVIEKKSTAVEVIGTKKK